jgi:hypothetical protein
MKTKPRFRIVAGMWAYCVEQDGYTKQYMGHTPLAAYELSKERNAWSA